MPCHPSSLPQIHLESTTVGPVWGQGRGYDLKILNPFFNIFLRQLAIADMPSHLSSLPQISLESIIIPLSDLHVFEGQEREYDFKTLKPSFFSCQLADVPFHCVFWHRPTWKLLLSALFQCGLGIDCDLQALNFLLSTGFLPVIDPLGSYRY